jgi:hypothetical protein
LSWRSHWYSACNQIGCKSPRTFGIKVGCNTQVGISNKLNPIFLETISCEVLWNHHLKKILQAPCTT